MLPVSKPRVAIMHQLKLKKKTLKFSAVMCNRDRTIDCDKYTFHSKEATNASKVSLFGVILVRKMSVVVRSFRNDESARATTLK